MTALTEAAEASLASAEEEIAAARAALAALPEDDVEGRRRAQGRLSYYSQLAERYRGELAQLKRQTNAPGQGGT